MQIAQTKAVGIVDDYGVHIRNIDATLHNRCRHQDVKVVVDKVHNGLLQLDRLHLTVRHRHTGLGTEPHQHTFDGHQILHAVVDKVDLTISLQLRLDNLLDQLLREGVRLGLYRSSVWWWSRDDRQVARAHQRELQGARYRRCGERKRIDTHTQLRKFLLCCHAKALLLIDDE